MLEKLVIILVLSFAGNFVFGASDVALEIGKPACSSLGGWEAEISKHGLGCRR